MSKNIMKRLLAMSMAFILSFSTLGITAHAEGNSYEAADTYVLKYNSELGNPVYEYFSPYKARVIANGNERNAQAFVRCLFNINDTTGSDFISAYCADAMVHDGTGLYRRINLEDSTYIGSNAGLLRSIVLNSFPNVDVEALGEAAGIEGLTVCEAVFGTQLAIWKTVHGDNFEILDYYYNLTVANKWAEGTDLYKSIIEYGVCRQDVTDGYATKSNSKIEEHTVALFDYLTGLKPTAPAGVAVSESAFASWSDALVLTYDENDGLYDVTVEAVVNVEMTEGDELKLSAVMDDSTYYSSKPLTNGENKVTLSIENVPAAVAKGTVTLAIDGRQTAADVFLFDDAGNRDENQTLIGKDDSQLPIHAEIKIEPERILNFYKTTPVTTIKDGEGKEVKLCFPLEGITFDIYLIAEMDEYASGTVVLPENASDYVFTDLDDDDDGVVPDATLTTGADGKASISLTKSNMPDGVYLVKERDHVAIKAPVEPFYIMIPNTNESGEGWEYDITVRPKNEVVDGPEVKKDVIEIEKEDKSGDEEQRFSVAAGEEFTWIIRGEIPVELSDAKEYVITDELDYRLSYIEESLVVKVEKATAESDNSALDECVLVDGTDYILTVSDDTATVKGGDMVESKEEAVKKLEVKLTATGMKKVAESVGMDYADYEVRVYFNTIIDGDVADTMGEDIANQATLNYTNSVNYKYKAESDIPEVYTCGINIYKYDAKNSAVALDGAVFKLAKVVDQATEGVAPLVTKEKETVYVIYEEFYTAIDEKTGELSGNKEASVTTENGTAILYGLEKGDYYLVETKAPEGYNLLNYPVKVTLDEVSHLDDNKVEVANSNAFVLPETGGIGRTIFTVCGIALIGVAVVILIVKKKKDNEDEE